MKDVKQLTVSLHAAETYCNFDTTVYSTDITDAAVGLRLLAYWDWSPASGSAAPMTISPTDIVEIILVKDSLLSGLGFLWRALLPMLLLLLLLLLFLLPLLVVLVLTLLLFLLQFVIDLRLRGQPQQSQPVR